MVAHLGEVLGVAPGEVLVVVLSLSASGEVLGEVLVVVLGEALVVVLGVVLSLSSGVVVD